MDRAVIGALLDDGDAERARLRQASGSVTSGWVRMRSRKRRFVEGLPAHRADQPPGIAGSWR